MEKHITLPALNLIDRSLLASSYSGFAACQALFTSHNCLFAVGWELSPQQWLEPLKAAAVMPCTVAVHLENLILVCLGGRIREGHIYALYACMGLSRFKSLGDLICRKDFHNGAIEN